MSTINDTYSLQDHTITFNKNTKQLVVAGTQNKSYSISTLQGDGGTELWVKVQNGSLKIYDTSIVPAPNPSFTKYVGLGYEHACGLFQTNGADVSFIGTDDIRYLPGALALAGGTQPARSAATQAADKLDVHKVNTRFHHYFKINECPLLLSVDDTNSLEMRVLWSPTTATPACYTGINF